MVKLLITEVGSSKSLNIPITKVIALKESKLNLNSIGKTKNKKEKQILQALVFAYQSLISYCIEHFIKQAILHSEKIDIDEAIPIVISGGTSCPSGFLGLFKEVFKDRSDFPFEIGEIRKSDNPMGSVASGCLIFAAWSQIKNNSNKKWYKKIFHYNWEKHKKRPWTVHIKSKGNKTFYKQFKTEIEAAQAYNNYVIEHNLNKPLNKKQKGKLHETWETIIEDRGEKF